MMRSNPIIRLGALDKINKIVPSSLHLSPIKAQGPVKLGVYILGLRGHFPLCLSLAVALIVRQAASQKVVFVLQGTSHKDFDKGAY